MNQCQIKFAYLCTDNLCSDFANLSVQLSLVFLINIFILSFSGYYRWTRKSFINNFISLLTKTLTERHGKITIGKNNFLGKADVRFAIYIWSGSGDVELWH